MNREQIAEARKTYKQTHPYVVVKFNGQRKQRAVFGAELTANGRLKMQLLTIKSVEIPVYTEDFNEDGSTLKTQVGTTHDARLVPDFRFVSPADVISATLPAAPQTGAQQILDVILSTL